MARIRTIKPEFFTSEDIVSLSPMARILYIALWCEADREGRLVWKPLTFKLRYLPADDCDIKALCNEIVERGLVRLYGEGLAYMPSFGKHQHINPRESISTLPVPPNYVPESPKKITADIRAEVMERDGHKCVRCNATEDLTLDHILPQSLSGPHIAENLRCMCRACNSARPVSGKGLADDLAIDGLTVDSLRVKFGIDASRRVSTRANQDRHVQVGREGKGKEGNEDSGEPRGDSPPAAIIPLVDGTEATFTQAQVDDWGRAYPAVDVAQQLRQMRAWCNANPTRRKTARGVEAFIVGWLTKEQNSGRPSKAVAGSVGPKHDREAADRADPRPKWALDAGFPNVYEARNGGCNERTAHLFRDGKHIEVAA